MTRYNGNAKMKKGQAAIEFILLVVVMLLFINTAIVTNANTASDAALDVSKMGKARLGVEKLINVINYVGFGGEGTKQVVTVFIPENATITCTSGNGTGEIGFSVQLEGSADVPDYCSGDPVICTSKKLPVYTDIDLSCPDYPLNAVQGPNITNYTISKGTGNTVDVAIG